MPTKTILANKVTTPPVNAAGVEPESVDVVMLLDVLLLALLPVDIKLMAAQDVKFWLPKKLPTVYALVIYSVWRMAIAVETLVTEKLMANLKVVAGPLQMGVAVVPS